MPAGGREEQVQNVTMTVNGKAVTAEVEPRTLLVQLLRDTLRLTGTHVGCDTSQCGACVVHIDGKAVKSCTALALSCEHHGLQCGFCTPGMIMSAIDIVNRRGPDLPGSEIREELEGNICRCTGYHNIVKAIAAGAQAMGQEAGGAQAGARS